jgi:hypothetical protein
VAKVRAQWRRRIDELDIAYWRHMGAHDAADVLAISYQAFEVAWKRGEEEFEARWPTE